MIKNINAEAFSKIEPKAKKVIESHNNSVLKYNIYHRRSALILETYNEELLMNLDYNSVPSNIIHELTALNLMSALLEPALKGFTIGEVAYTIDGCIVRKDKVEEYNKQLKEYTYYNIENLKIIAYDSDATYDWNILSEEDIKAYEEKAKSIVISEDAEKLVCQIELLRHTQPLDISLRLLEIRKLLQRKCSMLFINSSKVEQDIIPKEEQTDLSTSDWPNYMSPDGMYVDFYGVIRDKVKDSFLIRKLREKVQNKKS